MPCVVIASKITPIHITFECPYCWSKYKKNGEPTAHAKRMTHRCGSCGDTSNRVEHRSSTGHCTSSHRGTFEIHITEDTVVIT